MNWMLRGFGLSRFMRAPENDDGFDTEDDDQDLELDEELEDDEDVDLEDQDDDTEEDQDDEPPRQSRGETRAAKLARERNDLREENERLKREATARSSAPADPAPQPRETQEQFNARLAAMEPVERIAYLADLNARNTNAEIAGMKFMLADQTDKLTFDSFCGSNAEARKLTGEVDKRLADYRKGGVNIPRMDVLKHILGERALNNLGRSRTKAERAAEARREQQRGRPSAGRGDAPREGRDTGGTKSARDKRVENMKI